MKSQEILSYCIENGLLLDNEVLDIFSESSDVDSVKVIIQKIKNLTQKRIITKNVFEKNREKVNEFFLGIPEDKRKSLESLKIKLGLSIEISKNSLILSDIPSKTEPNIPENSQESKRLDDSEIKLLYLPNIISNKIEVQDFVKHLRGRLSEMKTILQERPELVNLVSINKLTSNRHGVSIIGIVSEKKITKNKNILLEIEDLTGKIKVIISNNRPDSYKKAEDIALDSVIGLKGSGNREIFFANEIIFPDSAIGERKKSPVEEYALFTGDIHAGSKLFLEENFLKFIDYLNGKIPNTPETEKIKYLFVAGDLIAGVGIYEGQDRELTIKDVEGQYARVAELLGKIRKGIKIILVPGNHDALRIMEPQPMLDEKYAWPLYNLKNIAITGNPSFVNIGSKKDFSGFDVLTYHGYSFHYYANNISSLVQEKAAHNPDKIMHYLLKNRHLAPTHSSTLFFPLEKDPLLIKKIPDIFVSGHTHKCSVSYYNNILNISSSCWESKTAFQEKMGNEPDFCKVPMLNLKTRAVKILDFE